MNHNPYAPPRAEVLDAAAADSRHGASVSARLYSVNQLFAAAFIGSPIAAAWFAAYNLRALGEPNQARRIVLWGLLATAAAMALAFFLPDGTPNTALPLAYSFAIRALGEKAFKGALGDHSQAGGVLASWWRVIGVSLLWLLLTIVGVIAMFLALEQLGFSPE